jgi:thiol:disulfide interchange protein
MIKTFLFSLLVFGLSGGTSAQGIKFAGGTLTEMQARGKAEHKLLFVDIYAVWCGPCKAMAKNVFTQASVADHFNAKYVNVQVDAEKGEGVDLAKKYAVGSFPTYLFIDGDGKLVYRIEGALTAEAFLAEAKKADEKFTK